MIMLFLQFAQGSDGDAWSMFEKDNAWPIAEVASVLEIPPDDQEALKSKPYLADIYSEIADNYGVHKEGYMAFFNVLAASLGNTNSQIYIEQMLGKDTIINIDMSKNKSLVEQLEFAIIQKIQSFSKYSSASQEVIETEPTMQERAFEPATAEPQQNAALTFGMTESIKQPGLKAVEAIEAEAKLSTDQIAAVKG